MNTAVNAPPVNPPWGQSSFLSEEGLRAAQEYYFQNHAKHAKLIAQGRNAQGLAKSFVRRKLSKEMGEDFKMYTGTAIGQAAAPQDMASLGIRGELNALLKHIYSRIAPTTPISSPIQEDLTILGHPLGAFEVCYAMVFYYNSLLRQYASFAANRRKVLKSIMDEELFKWIWRLLMGFSALPDDQKIGAEPVYLSAGLAFIPTEFQRVPLGQKVYEIGQFLLSKTLAESDLRIALSFYFVTYLRQLQMVLALRTSRQELDEVYSLLMRRVAGEPTDHPLVAIDALFGSRGSSSDGFEDLLKDEAQLTEYIPGEELAYFAQFEDFGNRQRLGATLKKLVPDVRRDQVEGQDTSLMPLLLTLRLMSEELRTAALNALPVPLLLMMRNRVNNVAKDHLADDLAEAIRAAMEGRKAEGHKVQPVPGTGKAAVASSVRVAPPQGAAASGTAPAAAARVVAARRPEPADPGEPAASRAPRESPRPRTATPTSPEVAAKASSQSQGEAVIDVPAILAWRHDGKRIAAISLSARELFELTGPEQRFLVPWVVFALRTGQVFGLAPDKVSKERVEQLVQALRRHAAGVPGQLPAEQRLSLLEQGQGASHTKLLLALVKAVGTARFLRVPEAMAPAIGGLNEKFGARLIEFLRNPNDDAFSSQRGSLSTDERLALAVLQRVARSQ